MILTYPQLLLNLDLNIYPPSAQGPHRNICTYLHSMEGGGEDEVG